MQESTVRSHYIALSVMTNGSVLWQIVQSNIIQLVNLGLVSVLKLVHGSKLMLPAFKILLSSWRLGRIPPL